MVPWWSLVSSTSGRTSSVIAMATIASMKVTVALEVAGAFPQSQPLRKHKPHNRKQDRRRHFPEAGIRKHTINESNSLDLLTVAELIPILNESHSLSDSHHATRGRFSHPLQDMGLP